MGNLEKMIIVLSLKKILLDGKERKETIEILIADENSF